MFIGGFQHPPNVDAVLWYAREILPRLRRSLPGVTTYVIGSRVPPAIKEVLRDLRTCTEETPRELRRVMREMAAAFVDRLRRCERVEV